MTEEDLFRPEKRYRGLGLGDSSLLSRLKKLKEENDRLHQHSLSMHRENVELRTALGSAQNCSAEDLTRNRAKPAIQPLPSLPKPTYYSSCSNPLIVRRDDPQLVPLRRSVVMIGDNGRPKLQDVYLVLGWLSDVLGKSQR